MCEYRNMMDGTQFRSLMDRSEETWMRRNVVYENAGIHHMKCRNVKAEMQMHRRVKNTDMKL